MCHFITATLPHDSDLRKSEEIFKQYHLKFEKVENESVGEHLEKGDFYILTTKGICDCGTILASQNPEKYRFDETQVQKFKDKAIEKLKSKGWSDTKISRWQKEQDLSAEKVKRQEEQAHEYSMTRTDDWINFIRALLSSKATTRIGILVHEYRGGIDNRIKILGKQTVPLEKLSPKFLVEMSEDVIYDFVS
jgi:hypothetical protein